MDDYAAFLARKAIADPCTGLAVVPPLCDAMFPFQRDITAWALRRGRAALFEGTGLGKSLQELAWADAVHRETGRDILHLAPLAVSAQMAREADKFALAGKVVREQSDCIAGNNITNYQKLEHFDLSRFGGVILDESSILKSYDGHYRTRLIEACAHIPFRLGATATPAPNDYMELGNHAEFLGVMSYTDMLATFFVHDGGDTQKWRLKGHAEDEFWRWMASWAVMLRKPSDLGYSDEGYDLPPLRHHSHVVRVDEDEYDGLFPLEAQTLSERLKARRDTVDSRVAKAVDIVISSFRDKLSKWDGNQNTKIIGGWLVQSSIFGMLAVEPWVIWCHLNDEQKALKDALGDLCISIDGSHSEEEKEQLHLSWLSGHTPILIVKPSMFGHGLNWQHCANCVFVGLNDSFEQVYQAIRRFWRFGQTKPVNVHFISAETEGAVIANLKRKEADADRMAAAMVRHMADLSSQAVRGSVRDRPTYAPTVKMELPSWM